MQHMTPSGEDAEKQSAHEFPQESGVMVINILVTICCGFRLSCHIQIHLEKELFFSETLYCHHLILVEFEF
jgi:hypothetical protein